MGALAARSPAAPRRQRRPHRTPRARLVDPRRQPRIRRDLTARSTLPHEPPPVLDAVVETVVVMVGRCLIASPQRTCFEVWKEGIGWEFGIDARVVDISAAVVIERFAIDLAAAKYEDTLDFRCAGPAECFVERRCSNHVSRNIKAQISGDDDRQALWQYR